MAAREDIQILRTMHGYDRRSGRRIARRGSYHGLDDRRKLGISKTLGFLLRHGAPMFKCIIHACGRVLVYEVLMAVRLQRDRHHLAGEYPFGDLSVSYTHLTLPTKRIV